MVNDIYKKFEKAVVNSGFGKLSQTANFEEKMLPNITKDFAAITGQQPSARPARMSISSFKLREGNIIGLKATLRRARMKQFVEKFLKVVLPRVRDFHGIPMKNVDEGGNLTIGVKENIVFPEINPEHSVANFGVQVTLVPKDIKNRAQAIELYKEIGVPFAKEIVAKKQVKK